MSDISVFTQEKFPNPYKTYMIVPIYAENMAIDVNKLGENNGANIQLWEKNNGPNQKFRIIFNKNKDCCFEVLHCKNKVLDVHHSEVKNHSNIQLYTRNDTNAQYFRVIKAGEDCYSFLSTLNFNYCIDANGSGRSNGTNIQLYQRNYSDAQKFKLIGENYLPSALEYALKYAEEYNGNYDIFNPNSANFCSQCLYAGGVDYDNYWYKNSYCFINEVGFLEYFKQKGVEWKEDVDFKEVNSGDIIFDKNLEFCKPIFIIKRLKRGLIYCGNSMGMNKGIIKLDIIPGLLKTSSLFK